MSQYDLVLRVSQNPFDTVRIGTVSLAVRFSTVRFHIESPRGSQTQLHLQLAPAALFPLSPLEP